MSDSSRVLTRCIIKGCGGEGRWKVRGKASTPDGSLVDVAGKVCDDHHRQISPPLRGVSIAPANT